MKQFIIVLILLAPAFNFAQSGFFGKKNIVEFSTQGSIPLIYNLRNKMTEVNAGHKAKNGTLNNQLNWFNYGFNIQDFHYFKDRFGIGIHIGYDFQKAYTNENMFYDAFYNGGVEMENLSMTTLTIMPKIEIGSLNGILPMGLSHQLGIGYTITKIKERNYLLNTGGSIISNDELKDFGYTVLDFDLKHKGLSLLYQMNYRLPLSKHLFLNYGFKYALNLVNLGNYFNYNYVPFSVSNKFVNDFDTKKMVQKARISNMVQFTIGLGFAY